MPDNQAEEGRFRYAHGAVWDAELGQPVHRNDDADVAGAKIGALSAWTPAPRLLHIYRMPDKSLAWSWERRPPGGRFAR